MIDITSHHNSVSIVLHMKYFYMTHIGDYGKIYSVRNMTEGENSDELESLTGFLPSLFSGFNQHGTKSWEI